MRFDREDRGVFSCIRAGAFENGDSTVAVRETIATAVKTMRGNNMNQSYRNMKQARCGVKQMKCITSQAKHDRTPSKRSQDRMAGLFRNTVLILILILSLSLAACGSGAPVPVIASSSSSAEASATAVVTAETTPAATPESTAKQVPVPTEDRAGNPITVPSEVKTIISLAPSFTESLIVLGLVDKIIAIDQNATGLAGVKKEWPVFDLMAPDAEKLLQLNPDIIIATPMSTGGGEDPFKLLKDAGICVVYIPSSDSIQGIKDDLLFLGALTSTTGKAMMLVDEMQTAIDDVAAIGKTITEKKRVYFEIGAAPSMYSFGSGVFLNEMIELIGAVNVFADQKSWIAVSQEAALAANPDVILTNVNYIPDAIGEIKARDGWSAVKAVKDGNVFYIDNMSSSLPNQGIVKALHEMAKTVYPDKY